MSSGRDPSGAYLCCMFLYMISICRRRFGPMSKLDGIWHFLGMLMSRHVVSKDERDSGLWKKPVMRFPVVNK